VRSPSEYPPSGASSQSGCFGLSTKPLDVWSTPLSNMNIAVMALSAALSSQLPCGFERFMPWVRSTSLCSRRSRVPLYSMSGPTAARTLIGSYMKREV
jgi:hypothetical protein